MYDDAEAVDTEDDNGYVRRTGALDPSKSMNKSDAERLSVLPKSPIGRPAGFNDDFRGDLDCISYEGAAALSSPFSFFFTSE